VTDDAAFSCAVHEFFVGFCVVCIFEIFWPGMAVLYVFKGFNEKEQVNALEFQPA
jgi:hypothetical protein